MRLLRVPHKDYLVVQTYQKNPFSIVMMRPSRALVSICWPVSAVQPKSRPAPLLPRAPQWSSGGVRSDIRNRGSGACAVGLVRFNWHAPHSGHAGVPAALGVVGVAGVLLLVAGKWGRCGLWCRRRRRDARAHGGPWPGAWARANIAQLGLWYVRERRAVRRLCVRSWVPFLACAECAAICIY